VARSNGVSDGGGGVVGGGGGGGLVGGGGNVGSGGRVGSGVGVGGSDVGAADGVSPGNLGSVKRYLFRSSFIAAGASTINWRQIVPG